MFVILSYTSEPEMSKKWRGRAAASSSNDFEAKIIYIERATDHIDGACSKVQS